MRDIFLRLLVAAVSNGKKPESGWLLQGARRLYEGRARTEKRAAFVTVFEATHTGGRLVVLPDNGDIKIYVCSLLRSSSGVRVCLFSFSTDIRRRFTPKGNPKRSSGLQPRGQQDLANLSVLCYISEKIEDTAVGKRDTRQDGPLLDPTPPHRPGAYTTKTRPQKFINR